MIARIDRAKQSDAPNVLERTERDVTTALHALAPPDEVAEPLSREWFAAALDASSDWSRRLRAWIVLGVEVASGIAYSGDARICHRLSHALIDPVLVSLSGDIKAEARGEMLLAAISILRNYGESVSRLGHPVAKAFAARWMVDLWRRYGPGGERSIVLQVEAATHDLIEIGRTGDALALIEMVPAEIRAAYADWPRVEEFVVRYVKPAWSERQTTDDVVLTIRQNLRRLLALDDEAAELGRRGLETFENGKPFDPVDLLEIANALQQYTRKLGDTDPGAALRIEMMNLCHDALKEAGPVVERAIARAKEIEAVFRARRAWDDVATTRFALARMYHHLDETDEAVAWYVAAIGAQSKLSSDPRLPRFLAGVTESLRSMYSHLIDAFADGGRTAKAMLVAEHCKGITWRRINGRGTRPLETIVSSAADLLELAGFVSYFVEDRGLALFFVDATGCCEIHRIGVARATLEGLVAAVRPNGWRPVGRFVPSNERALRELSFLVQPLSRMLDDAKRRPDRLVFAPDGILHNVPWHLLRVDGKRLIEDRPLICVLCLDHLTSVRSHPGTRPSGSAIFVVPSEEERTNEQWECWMHELSGLLTSAGTPAQALFGERGTAAALIAEIEAAFVHVRCHGHFPDGSGVHAEEAFSESGLLLARDSLPPRSVHGLSFTPALLLESLQARSRAMHHIALESCVSGVVHDGAAGDPISLPWVLALCGARAVVASHWDVETRYAEAFFTEYYGAMLGGGMIAAEAHRKATLVVLERYGEAAAAFRLLGDYDDE